MIFDKNIYNQIYNWDDYSHWMRIYKIYSIYGLNHLKVSELVLTYNSFPNNIIQHYPAIHSYVASILFPYPEFETFNIYILQLIFIIIIILDIYIYFKVPINKLLTFLLISLVLLSSSTPLNHNFLSDIVISALVILGLIQLRVNNNNQNLFLAGSLFAYAIMIKPPTAIVLIFIAFINIMFIDNKWKHKQVKAIALFISVSIPYILFLLIYVQYLNISSNIQAHGSYIGIMNNVINNLLAFFRFELLGPIFSLEPSKSSVNMISILFICWCFIVKGDKKNVIYIISTLFIYLLYLAITYKFVVLDSSGGRFASFDRYFLSYYIFIIFYYMYYFFTNTNAKIVTNKNIDINRINSNGREVWILLMLLYFNISYFIPKLILLLIPTVCIIYLLKTILQNKLSVINYLLMIFIVITLKIFPYKFYPPETMIKNGNFMEQFSVISRGSNEHITIEVCNPTQYDYLAFTYYSDFSNNFSIIEAVNCIGDFKYKIVYKKTP
jgi:hypothetical protein